MKKGKLYSLREGSILILIIISVIVIGLMSENKYVFTGMAVMQSDVKNKLESGEPLWVGYGAMSGIHYSFDSSIPQDWKTFDYYRVKKVGDEYRVVNYIPGGIPTETSVIKPDQINNFLRDTGRGSLTNFRNIKELPDRYDIAYEHMTEKSVQEIEGENEVVQPRSSKEKPQEEKPKSKKEEKKEEEEKEPLKESDKENKNDVKFELPFGNSKITVQSKENDLFTEVNGRDYRLTKDYKLEYYDTESQQWKEATTSGWGDDARFNKRLQLVLSTPAKNSYLQQRREFRKGLSESKNFLDKSEIGRYEFDSNGEVIKLEDGDIIYTKENGRWEYQIKKYMDKEIRPEDQEKVQKEKEKIHNEKVKTINELEELAKQAKQVKEGEEMLKSQHEEILKNPAYIKANQELAYRTTWELLNFVLDKWAFPMIDEMCKEDWEASEPATGVQNIHMGTPNINPTESSPNEEPCTDETMTAQLRITGNYQHRITYAIQACKLANYKVFLQSNSQPDYTVEEGYVGAGDSISDDVTVTLPIPYDSVCVKTGSVMCSPGVYD